MQVCVGTACHVLGSGEVLEEFRRRLGIGAGEDTDADGRFTVDGGRLPRLLQHRAGGAASTARPTATSRRGGSPRCWRTSSRDCAPRESPADERGRRRRPGPRPRGAALPVHGLPRLGGAARCAARCALRPGGSVLALAVGEVAAAAGPTRRRWSSSSPRAADSFRYGAMRPAEARELLLAHAAPRGIARRARVAADRLLERLVRGEAAAPVTRFPREHRPAGAAAPDESRQVRIATEGAGELAPLDLDEYVRRGGFAALRAVPARARPRRRSSTRCAAAACAAGAAAGYPTGGEVGAGARRGRGRGGSSSSATGTRGTRARSWTACCWSPSRSG